MLKLTRLLPVTRPGVSKKHAFCSCATEGKLAPSNMAKLLTAMAKLATKLVS